MSIRKINATYQLGEVVWARVNGYPWWPGLIVENDRPEESYKYKVKFFAHPTWSYLEANKIAKYEDNFEEFSTHKRVGKRLKASIDAAEDYLSSIASNKIKERISTTESDGASLSNEENSEQQNRIADKLGIRQNKMLVQIQHSKSVEKPEILDNQKMPKVASGYHGIVIPKPVMPQPARQEVVSRAQQLRYRLKAVNALISRKFTNQENEVPRYKPIHKEIRGTAFRLVNVEKLKKERMYETIQEIVENSKWKRPYVKKIYTALRFKEIQSFKAQELSLRAFNRLVSSVEPRNIESAFTSTVLWIYKCSQQELSRYVASADRFTSY